VSERDERKKQGERVSEQEAKTELKKGKIKR
jgi:hypothetical protein